jgi:hypothetical protein
MHPSSAFVSSHCLDPSTKEDIKAQEIKVSKALSNLVLRSVRQVSLACLSSQAQAEREADKSVALTDVDSRGWAPGRRPY